MSDAKFEDAADFPLRLIAQDGESLLVLSALLQDAVFLVSDMAYDRVKRRFAVLLNRFRWEDVPRAERAGHSYERVRAMLVFDNVQAVQSHDIDRADTAAVLSLLSIAVEPLAEGAARIRLNLAGQGGLAISVEVLEVSLADVTRPHLATSAHKPQHRS